MGKIVQLGQHKWELPAPPKTQEDVFFVKESKANQYWRRQDDLPDYYFQWDSETRLFSDYTVLDASNQLISLNREDSKRFLYYREREMKRRCLGAWFMNNGELTYITGGHYFFLQWAQMLSANEENGSPYGSYREFQRDLAYHWQMVKEDPNCIGTYILKCKKSGVTQFFASDYADESTRMRGKWFGMMSKVLLDCRDTNFMMYKNIFENMPNVMKPAIANENLTMMFFGNPVNNKNSNRKTRSHYNGNLEWLNTRVTALPTKANGYDGGKPFRAWHDEFPKYEEPYPEQFFAKTEPTVQMGMRVTGKYLITSYTPEDDSKGKDQAEKVYLEAGIETINKDTHRTKNGMYNHFVSALDAFEGIFDKYGKSDRQKARIFIDNKKAQKKNDKKALQDIDRQWPTTPDEAWRAGGLAGAVFNNVRLGAKKMDIIKELALGHTRYIECNLEWSGKYQASAIRIDEITEKEKLANKNGLWRMWTMPYWRQDSLNRPFNNNTRDANGKLMPDKDIRFVMAMDPTNYRYGNDVIAGSNNSLWVFALPDLVVNSTYRKKITGCPAASYFFRHDKPSDTYNDIKKAIYLWGCPILIEGNMPTWVSMLIEDGLENFLLIYDSKTKAIVPYNATDHKTMITTQGGKDTGTINELVREGQEYLGEPIPGQPDNLDNVNDEILLAQLMELNTADTKKSDHAMGFLWALIAMKSMDAYISRMLERLQDYSQATMESVLNWLD